MPWGAIYAELGIVIVQLTPDVRTLVLFSCICVPSLSLYTISSVSVLGSFLMNDAVAALSVQDGCADVILGRRSGLLVGQNLIRRRISNRNSIFSPGWVGLHVCVACMINDGSGAREIIAS